MCTYSSHRCAVVLCSACYESGRNFSPPFCCGRLTFALCTVVQMSFVLSAYYCFDCSASCVLRAASELTHTYIFTTLLPSSQSINRVLCSLNCASFYIRYRVIIRIYLDIVEYLQFIVFTKHFATSSLVIKVAVYSTSCEASVKQLAKIQQSIIDLILSTIAS